MRTIKQLLTTVAVLLCSMAANAQLFIVDGICYRLISNSDLTVGVVNIPSLHYEGDIVIPSTINYQSKDLTVISIEQDAFKDCTGLTSVAINAKNIGYHAFKGCTGLTSVTMGNNVETIKEEAFYGCSGLTSITIPNSVTAIKEGAFYDCSGLTSITIPNSVTAINKSVFANCIGLTSIIIPNSVGYIGDYAFRDCHNLTSITIPNSVKSIGKSAFSCGGGGLKDLRIEDGNRTLTCANEDNKGLFYNSSLETIYLGRSIVNENYNQGGIFCESLKLKQLTIGDSVTNIDNSAFRNCKNLTNVTIGKNVKTIGEGAFWSCYNLRNIEIPHSVISIGHNAFQECINLTKVSIGDNVKLIDSYTFYGCNKLTSIIIGNSVERIMEYAFAGCYWLTDIYFMGETPPIVRNNNYFENHCMDATLYVPQGSLSAYQTADVWKEFWNIQEHNLTGVSEVSAGDIAIEVTANGIALSDTDGKDVAVYTVAGALVEKIDSYAGEEIALDKGVYVLRIGNKTIKVRL